MSKLTKKINSFIFVNTVAISSIHLLNKWISSGAVIDNLLHPEKGSFFTWKDVDIFYKKQGEGSPVLLIHNLTVSSSSYEWNKLTEQLKKYHTIYTVDLPGCGNSDRPALKYTCYYYVQFITDFISTVIKEKPDIIVNGLSASFVLMAGKLQPELYNKLIMINPNSIDMINRTPDNNSSRLFTLFSIPVIGTMLYHLSTCKTNIELLIKEKLFNNIQQSKTVYADVCYEAAHKYNGKGKYLFASLMGHYLCSDPSLALKEDLKDIHIIYGNSIKNSRETINEYKKLCPDISVTEIPNSRMLPHVEKCDETFRVISGILN